MTVLNQSHSFKTKCIQIHESNLEPVETISDQRSYNVLDNADDIIEYETEFLEDDPVIRLEENYGEEGNDNSAEDDIIYFAEDVEDLKVECEAISDAEMGDLLEESDDPNKTEIEREEFVNSEKVKRKSYFTYQKLEAIRYAEESGSNRQAARVFSVDESCIRKWRLNKALIASIDKERSSHRTPRRKSNLHWPTLDQMLKAWVIEQVKSGATVKPKQVKEKSIELAEKLNLEDFKGSNSYVFKFMRRYQFPSQVSSSSLSRNQ